MIAIGIDLVTINRFDPWCDYHQDKLAALFAPHERAEFVLKAQLPRIQRATFLASRFAVKEAFYKALSSWLMQHGLTDQSFSLKRCAPLVWVSKENIWQIPQLCYDKNAFEKIICTSLPSFQAHVSLSHEGEQAVAQVLLNT